MFERENLNSVAIHNLFHLIPTIFELQKSTSFKSIPSLKNLSINEIYNPVAIDNSFNTITVSFHSVFLFLSDIFSFFLRILTNRIIITPGGGEKLMYGLDL